MFYKNKQTSEVVEMIHSDNEFCIYVPLTEIEALEGELNGNIFYGNKKAFKREWKKVKGEFTTLEAEAKESIISTFLFDRRRLKSEQGLDDLVVQTQVLYNHSTDGENS